MDYQNQTEASLKAHVAMEAASREYQSGLGASVANHQMGDVMQSQPSEQSDYSVIHELEDLARKFTDASHEGRTIRAAVRVMAKNMRAAEIATGTAEQATRKLLALTDQIRLAKFALGAS